MYQLKNLSVSVSIFILLFFFPYSFCFSCSRSSAYRLFYDFLLSQPQPPLFLFPYSFCSSCSGSSAYSSSTTSCYHSHSRHCSPITMTEVLLDMAEEHFLKGNSVSAFKWASLAQELDPNFGSVNRYVEVYRINLAAFIIHPIGERNWYKLLGIEQHSVSCQAITHKFVKLAKMIDPEVLSPAAAPTALKHITMAWENLGEPDKRCAYHARVGLPPPILEKPQLEKPLEIASKKRSRLETQMEIASQKRCSRSHPPEIASQKRCSSSHPPENTSQKRCSSSHLPENASQKRCRVSSSHHVNRHRIIF